MGFEEIKAERHALALVPPAPTNAPPKPTFELTLSIGACAWVELAHRLVEEAHHIAKHGPLCKAAWGGAGTHGHVDITHRPEVTREAYEAELHAWWLAQKAATATGDGVVEHVAEGAS